MAALVGLAYLWVYIYSTFVYPTGDLAHYQAYAQVASPVVAVTAAGPVFYLMGRFMRRYGHRAFAAALAVVVLNVLIDASTVVSLAEDVRYSTLVSLVAAAPKLIGAYLGVRRPSR
jgi:hypothetical protein